MGGAAKVGHAQALSDGAEIIVRLYADGQMEPTNTSALIALILLDAASTG